MRLEDKIAKMLWKTAEAATLMAREDLDKTPEQIADEITSTWTVIDATFPSDAEI